MGDDGRDDDGFRWLVPEAGGDPVAHYGPSSLGKLLEDDTNLKKYRERQILQGLVSEPEVKTTKAGLRIAGGTDLLRVVRECKGDRDILNQVADDAYERSGANEKANYGTSLHTKTELHDLKARFKGPMDIDADFAAYITLTKGFRYTYVEPLVATEQLGVPIAGRPDRVGQVIDDLKTGADIYRNQLSYGIQLSTYAHCRRVIDDNGGRADLGCRTDIGYIFWVREGWAKLVEVDLVRGWQYAKLAVAVLEARKATGMLSSIRSTESARRNSIVKALKSQILHECHTEEDLKALWHKEKKHWTQELTDLVHARREWLAWVDNH